jgi:Glycosyltransferase sugar-binding region containing DXD motif
MIPKIIHYCWFGNGDLPDKVKYCINSWKRNLPEYEIKLWNETNFDVNSSKFTRESYREKKYAFVSDYVRLYALKQYGGVYLDVDVEVTRNIDQFLDKGVFMGFEEPTGGIASCIIGSTPSHKLINDLLNIYNDMSFINKHGKLNMTPNTVLIERLLESEYNLESNGKYQILKYNIHIFPFDYFHPLSLVTDKMYKSDNIYAIHHHTLLWVPWKTKLIRFIRLNILVPFIGKESYIKVVNYINKKTSIFKSN